MPSNVYLRNGRRGLESLYSCRSLHRPAARELGLSSSSSDASAMAAYAETYNGLGYHYRGRPSPYVYAGTDQYTRGKYVADGVYSATAVDAQVGVLALTRSIG